MTFTEIRSANNLNKHSEFIPLVFIHLPKAAGTTLDLIMQAAAHYLGLKHSRISGPLFHKAFGSGKTSTLEKLNDLAKIKLLSKSDIITGHLPFDIDNEIGKKAHYTTILRDPINRTVSHYKMGLRRKSWHPETPISNLLSTGVIPDNLMTRHLSGVRNKSKTCTELMYELAVKNLNDMPSHLIGITEHFDSYVRGLQSAFGLPTIVYENLQTSPSNNSISINRQDLINHNKFDSLLYQDALSIVNNNPPINEEHYGDHVIIASPSLFAGQKRFAILKTPEWLKFKNSLVCR